jgi:Flp pilus assembly protein TadG
MTQRSSNTTRAERGGVMTIVGVLLATGVLLGMGSITLDVGRVLVEKRELQNSADAASVSLAKDCYATPASCTTTQATAVALTNRNSADSTSTIVSVCSVNIPSSAAPTCGTASGAFADCAPLPPAFAAMPGLPYVEVRTKTRTSSGGSSFTNWLAGAAFGGPSTGAAGACARAAVGTPTDGTATLPLTFSACDWQHATGGTTGGGGGSYYASPVYNGSTIYGYNGAGQPLWPQPAITPPAQLLGQEVILLSQNPPGGATQPTGCATWNGHALPGGFGVLETDGDPCVIKDYPYHWMHTSTGNNIGCNLNNYVGKVINIPVFDCTADALLNREPIVAPATPPDPCDTGNGNNAYYHRAGYAQFYLSGYSLNVTGGIPNQRKSLVSNQFPCNGSDQCISGWFLNGSLSATAISGPPSGGGSFGTTGAVPAG